MIPKTAFIHPVGCVLALLIAVFPNPAQAAPVCAKVKIELSQQLALERLAFDARLVITNNTPDRILENLAVNLTIIDETDAEASQLFFTKIQSLDKISDVSGGGSIAPQTAAEVHWLLVPAPGAGGTDPDGREYYISGEVTYTVTGVSESMWLFPAMITVKPQPELTLDYFLPREVWADDPFTDPVEPPVPFALGVRTFNTGYGPAANLTISSGQAKIVENEQGLLIDFRLLGSEVNDKGVTPTLNLAMGQIEPRGCATGRWQMATTLSGKFVDFNANFTHASELGGTLTSLIQQVNTHFLTREILVDTPGSDTTRDFLSFDDPEGDRTPNSIYTSDCRQLPVNLAEATLTGTPAPQNPTVVLSTNTVTDWIYAKTLDPANGKLQITGVSRSDGKRLNPHNAWISEEKPTGKQSDPSAFYLNIVDHDTTGGYLVTYETPAVDTTPPRTTIVIGEPRYGSDPTHVTSHTDFLFTATDDLSGVASMVYDLDNTGYAPAVPFRLEQLILPPAVLSGPHEITYYSIDNAGNREPAGTTTVFVDDYPPAVSLFKATPAIITPSAPASSILAKQTTLSAEATDDIDPINLRYDIAAGSAATDTEFASLNVIRGMVGSLTSGVVATVSWNGRDQAGNFVPAGDYAIRLTATDQLGQAATAYTAVTVNEFLTVLPLSATSADQINPSLSGSKVVWQDYRHDQWDIYLLDFADVSPSNLTPDKLADQINPVINGDHVVWQDRSAGNWDIVLYDLTDSTEMVIAATIDDETNPVVKGNWVAYQAREADTWDIYLYNLTSGETLRITNDSRDQINPAISGDLLVWEDYRHGLADVYGYDLAVGAEIRLTDHIDNQTRPAVADADVVWVDQRDGNRELYRLDTTSGRAERLTYSPSDEAQPYLDGGKVIFVDYAGGLADPNLSLLDPDTRRTVRLISEPHRQEHPRLDTNRLVWQDNRSGVWQIYFSELTLPPTVATYPFVAGFNLAAVTGAMQAQYSGAFRLLDDWKGKFPVYRIESYNYANREMQQAELGENGGTTGTDFPLTENGALFVYADGGADLDLGEIQSCGPLSLKTGFNLVSFACLPDNYHASDLLRSLGTATVLSISGFDNVAARWLTLATKEDLGVSQDFPIRPGEGYIIYTNGDIANWTP